MLNSNPLEDFNKTLEMSRSVMTTFMATLMNAQKLQKFQNLLEQFMQECMLCVGDHTSITMQMFQALAKVKSPEDLAKLQKETFFTEYSKKYTDHVGKLVEICNSFLQTSHLYAQGEVEQFQTDLKKNAESMQQKFQQQFHETYNQFSQQSHKECSKSQPAAPHACCHGHAGNATSNLRKAWKTEEDQ